LMGRSLPSPQKEAERLFSQGLPRLIRSLKPSRIFFDCTRRARRMHNLPSRWAFPPPGYPPAHRHPQFELCVVLRGRCPFMLGEERFTLRRGDLVVLSPEVYHRELAADRCGPYQLLWFGCQKQALGAFLQDHQGSGRFNRQALRIWLQNFPEGLQIAHAIDWELWHAQPGHFHRVQGLLLELCGLVERSYRDLQRTGPGPAGGEALQRW